MTAGARRRYRYLGPDGEGAAALPDGVGAALGSDYCVHLMPTAARIAEAAAEASGRGAPLLLLTPYFRDAELKRALPVFRAIPPGADVDVAVNDWGALLALRGLFPRLRLSVGRLLSGQKRCPRIGVSPRLSGEGREWHGEGIFSSRRARAFLEEEMGVSGYHVDALPWGGAALAEFPGDREGVRVYVHSPFSVVTVSDACPWIGGVSSASVAACPRPCRAGGVALREASMGGELILKGKARFFETGGRPEEAGPLPAAVRTVLYGECP